MKHKKVLIIGLDCATPRLVFDRWCSSLPNLRSLMQRGIHAPLHSCIPPITVPAWSCMMTGKTPGSLGCYGFRLRSSDDYFSHTFALSTAVTADRVWDIAGRHNKKVILLGVPQTYPPHAVNGILVSCFLTPDTSSKHTCPPELAEEIRQVAGEYLIDVDDFRSENKHEIIRQCRAITQQRFRLLRHFLTTRPWDFAMMVDMGIDRMHHAFWKYMDADHPAHVPGSEFENTIYDYYRFVDKSIGEILSVVDSSTAVLIVSDHGAQAMQGGFCINDWLIKQGYLALSQQPEEPVPLTKVPVDWRTTSAWAEGGYCARLHVNLQGREPQGSVQPEQADTVLQEITGKLGGLTDPNGRPLAVRTYRPQDIYSEVNGTAPDLIIYIGDLAWRAIGSVGHDSLHTLKNDTGPDDANHTEDGICILFDPENLAPQQHCGCFSIYDIAPTVLDLLGLPVPQDMEGRSIRND